MTCEEFKKHRGDPEEDKDLIKLINEEKWKPCSNCGAMVGRNEGCNLYIFIFLII